MTATLRIFPWLCNAVDNADIIVRKLLACVPALGYSQSMSTPSRPYWLQKLSMLLTKLLMLVELATIPEKPPPPPPPPTEIRALTPLACAEETILDSLEG